MESNEQKVPTGDEGDDPVERIKSALREYEAAYDSLTDGTSVQTMKKLLENIEGDQQGGIVSVIIDESIRETRRRQRPELRTPLSLKDELVRNLVHVLGATDHEKVLGEFVDEGVFPLVRGSLSRHEEGVDFVDHEDGVLIRRRPEGRRQVLFGLSDPFRKEVACAVALELRADLMGQIGEQRPSFLRRARRSGESTFAAGRRRGDACRRGSSSRP